jgi:hypothetical protein
LIGVGRAWLGATTITRRSRTPTIRRHLILTAIGLSGALEVAGAIVGHIQRRRPVIALPLV